MSKQSKKYQETLRVRRHIYKSLKSINISSIEGKPISGCKNKLLLDTYLENFEPSEKTISLLYKSLKIKGSHNKSVYFIGNKEVGLVKIGYSNNPHKRLEQLKSGCPFPIKVLGMILCQDAEALERVYHRKYKHLRTHGEWFNINDELLSEIDLNA